MPIHYLSKINPKKLETKTALLRADLNIEPEYKTHSLRLAATIPTIKFLMKHKARIIIVSHRGRPTSKDRNKREYSLAPFAKILTRKLKRTVTFTSHYNPKEIRGQLKKSPAQIILLENIRFHTGEETNSAALAQKLASLADIYVNDAFANCHRRHASMVAITKHLPSYTGLLLENEIRHMDYAMKHHTRPLTVILGGAKTHTKIGIMEYFKKKADHILLGGGVANTFLKASGIDIGTSLHDKNTNVAPLLKCKNIHLPTDWLEEKTNILDIGPETEKNYVHIIKKSKTIIWNGPMGMIENKKFAHGSLAIAKAIGAKKNTAFTLAGGGETTSMIVELKLENTFDLLSTGGGAMLQYLSDKKLPAIEALHSSSS